MSGSGGSLSMDEFNMNDEIQEYVGDEPVSLTFNQFPLHTTDGVQAAWTFIKNPENADQYEQYEVEQFKQRVQEYARQLGVTLR
jgi:hypothetical protein